MRLSEDNILSATVRVENTACQGDTVIGTLSVLFSVSGEIRSFALTMLQVLARTSIISASA